MCQRDRGESAGTVMLGPLNSDLALIPLAKRLQLLPTSFGRSAHDATQNEKFKILMIFMASSLHESVVGATVSVHAM